MRIPSRLMVFPEENHWVLKGEDRRYWDHEVHAWLKKYMHEHLDHAASRLQDLHEKIL